MDTIKEYFSAALQDFAGQRIVEVHEQYFCHSRSEEDELVVVEKIKADLPSNVLKANKVREGQCYSRIIGHNGEHLCYAVKVGYVLFDSFYETEDEAMKSDFYHPASVQVVSTAEQAERLIQRNLEDECWGD